LFCATWCARCRCPSIADRLARDLQDEQAPHPAGHSPLHLVAFAVPEQRGAERRQHRDPARGDIGLRRQHQRVCVFAARDDVAHAHACVHGDHVGGDFIREAHDRTLQLGLELVQVLLVVGRIVLCAK